MSRTDNTMPSQLQREDGKLWPHVGGHWTGMRWYRKSSERRARQKVRVALLAGEEPAPTRHRGDARWMCY